MPGVTDLSDHHPSLLAGTAAGGVVLLCQTPREVLEKKKQRKDLYFSGSLIFWLLLEHTDGFPRKMCSNFDGDSCHACLGSSAIKIFHLWPQAGFKQGLYCIFELLGRISFS